MVNWEFFDNQTPRVARSELVDDLRAGEPADADPRRGPLCTFKETERVLAGFPDERRAERRRAPAAATLAGLRRLPASAAGGAPRRRRRPASDRARACRREAVTDAADAGPVRALGRARSPGPWQTYERTGGYAGAAQGAGDGPRTTSSQLVKDSGLRGRGGAGFPTGMKWGFIPQGDGKPHYLVVNADESEPGTCKDIPLMLADPHVLIEGIIIASLRDPRQPRVHLRARRGGARLAPAAARGRRGLRRPATSARTSSAPASTSSSSCTPARAPTSAARRPRCSTRSRAAAASRGCGRRSRRSPASTPARLWSTTSSRSPACRAILRQRRRLVPARWAPRSRPGFTLYSLSGHVTRPGQYEAPLGITLRELLELAGGMRDGHELKFWTPGGSSTPLLTDEHLDVPLDYEGVGAAGSMLGTKALQIFDETTCVVRAVLRWTEFYAHESCGKCTPVPRGHLLAGADPASGSRRGKGDRGGPRQAARHLRQHPRPVVLRARRRRGQPDRLVDQVLPRRVRRPLRAAAAARSTRPTRRAGPTASERTHDRHHRRARPAERPAAAGPGHADHRRLRGQRAQGHAGHPRRRAARHPDPAVLRPPAARPGRRLPAVPRRGRGPAQAAWRPARTTVTDGMVVKTQLTSPVADKAQQGVMELLLINHPLDCPVCDKGGECPLQNQAMSQRPRRVAASTDVKRTFAKPIADLHAGAARPRALRAVRALHPVLRSRSPATRSSSCSSAARCSRSASTSDEPFESYFSGNTVQICPVGALTGAAYRFRARPFDLVSTPTRLRALRVRLRAAHRPPARQGAAPAGRRRPARSTRSGTATRAASAFRYAAAGRPASPRPLVRDDDGELSPASLDRGARRGRRAAWRRRGTRRRRRADRRPAHRRGRLRLREVRPGRAAHQRHRLPRPAALGRGGRLPRPPGSPARAGPAASRTPTSRRRRRCCSSASSPRRSRRSSSCGCARRSASTAPRSSRVAPFAHAAACASCRHAAAGRARRRGARCSTPLGGRRRPDGAAPTLPRRCAQPGAVILVGERLADVAGRADRGRARWPTADRRPAGLGAAPGRRARRARGRRAADAAARRPPGRRPARPRRGRAPSGASAAARRARAATPARSWPPPRDGAARRRWSSAASTSTTCPTRQPRSAALDARAGFVVSLELRGQRGHRAGRRGAAGRAGGREGRAPSSTGRAGRGRSKRCSRLQPAAHARRPGAATCSADEMDVDLGLPDVAAAAPSSPRSAWAGARSRRGAARGRPGRAAAARRRRGACWRPGS